MSYWRSYSLIFLVVAIISYYLIPERKKLHLSPAIKLSEDQIQNDMFSRAKKISLKGFSGPESIVAHNGSLYTGVFQGQIVRIDDNNIIPFARLSSSELTLQECGRPLGMRISLDSKTLVVIDAYLGVFNISLVDGKHQKLFPLDEDFKVTFFNDLVILPNGSLIITETSTKFPLHQVLKEMADGQPNGRLIMVTPTTGEFRQITGNLHFPNGVELHRDGNSLLVAETTMYRILRIPMDGGPSSVYIDGLPGFPDNIRRSPRGGYWVPVSHLRNPFAISFLLDKLTNWPRLRYVLIHLYRLLSFGSLPKTPSSMLLRIDKGKIIEVLGDPSNEIPNVSEVYELDGNLYTGSYFLPYIGHFNYSSDI